MAKAKRRAGQTTRKPAQTTPASQPKAGVQQSNTPEIDQPNKLLPREPKNNTIPQSSQERPGRSQQREGSRATARIQARSTTRQRYQKKQQRGPLILIGSVLLLLVVVIGFFVYLSTQNSGNTTGQKPTDPVVLKAINTVDPTVLDAVNTGGIDNPITATKGSPPLLKGSTGKPEIFYDGAEYCPFCAAQRWSTAVALSRFGKFTKLPETTSSSTDSYPNTATLSFYGSAYSSSYLDFVSVEETTNQPTASGGYTPLQTPTADEADIIKTYNGPPYTTQPGIPFISVGNHYLQLQRAYDPAILANLSQQDIANDLSNSSSPVAKGILGGANYLTAAICTVTNNQPASVCTTGVIPSLEQALPKAQASSPISGAQTAIALAPRAVIGRRED